jgi:hypothetical protein
VYNSQLPNVASVVGTATAGDFTGVPLCDLLGGNSTGTASDAGKNAT